MHMTNKDHETSFTLGKEHSGEDADGMRSLFPGKCITRELELWRRRLLY